METIQRKKTYHKKADLRTKTGKYFIAKKTTKTKEEAKLIAGFSPATNTTDIEKTKTYEAIEQKYLGDHLKDILKGKEWAELLGRNARQDKNVGSSNQALDMYQKIVEPQQKDVDGPDNVIIVFKQ